MKNCRYYPSYPNCICSDQVQCAFLYSPATLRADNVPQQRDNAVEIIRKLKAEDERLTEHLTVQLAAVRADFSAEHAAFRSEHALRVAALEENARLRTVIQNLTGDISSNPLRVSQDEMNRAHDLVRAVEWHLTRTDDAEANQSLESDKVVAMYGAEWFEAGRKSVRGPNADGSGIVVIPRKAAY